MTCQKITKHKLCIYDFNKFVMHATENERNKMDGMLGWTQLGSVILFNKIYSMIWNLRIFYMYMTPQSFVLLNGLKFCLTCILTMPLNWYGSTKWLSVALNIW